MADDAKARGNAAFKEGDYVAAIDAFSEAIEADPTNHVLYSNRSAAYAFQKEFQKALDDADKCVSLNKEWAKGYSRRGAALYGLQKWKDAEAAYEAGLKLDPSSSVMKEELRKIKQQLAPPSVPNPSSYGMVYPKSGSCGLPEGKMGLTAARVLSLLALLSGAFHMLPLVPRFAVVLYKVSIFFILLLFLLNLVSHFPLKFSTLTDAKFKAAQESQCVMLLLFMLLSPPLPFALMPFLPVVLLNVCYAFKQQLAPLPLIGSRVTFFTTPEGDFQVRAFGAMSELMVAVGTVLLVVFQGTRALLLGFFFFQYVVRRHRTHELTQQTVRILNDKVKSIFAHKYMPAPLQPLYAKLTGAISWLAQKAVQ